MLKEGGREKRVLSCRGKYMPFWDRSIDLVVLSHPQKDHLEGLIPVIERYNIGYLVSPVIGNDTEGYKKLIQLISQKNIKVKNLYQDDAFSLGEVRFTVLWPQREWVAQKIQNPNDKIQIALGKTVLGITTDADLNSFSYYLHMKYRDFDALFTGDGDSKMQDELLASADLPDIEVLKFPHHGSKTGILASLLDKLRPEWAIISVGMKNSYGHPAKESLELLKSRGIFVRRTDLEGDIEIITAGKGN